jgi:NodT family efflux transporter outer membrane factor (OMF) lipoprotein
MRGILSFLRLACFVILFGAVSSCSWSKRALPLDLPSTALEIARQDTASEVLIDSEDWVPSEWWNLFNDEQLTQFILTAFARNPTLQAAQASILLAIANADRVRATLFPYLFWGADVSMQKLSKTGVIPFGPISVPNTPSAKIPVYFRLYETQLNLTYDFDIWGKNRNTLRAAIGEVRANIADEAFARLQLGISVAQVYYQLQIDYKLQQIAQALVTNREEYLTLIQKRVQDNLDNALTLLTAETNLAVARQVLLQIQGEIAVCEYQLKTYLAGDFEDAIFTVNVVDQPLPQVPFPCELPLHLIAHRPDIIAQLWLIGSAGRQIEVAKAGFYPDFNISALFGFQTIHFRELFRWPSVYYNVDPAVSLPIFDGGRLLANLHGSEVNYDLAIFQYNNLVLNAVKEVLDGIAVLTNSEQQLQQYEEALDYQEQILQLTALRMTYSLDSNLDYLNNEANLLNARNQEVVAFGNTLQAILALIKALGGGYDVCDG